MEAGGGDIGCCLDDLANSSPSRLFLIHRFTAPSTNVKVRGRALREKLIEDLLDYSLINEILPLPSTTSMAARQDRKF